MADGAKKNDRKNHHKGNASSQKGKKEFFYEGNVKKIPADKVKQVHPNSQKGGKKPNGWTNVPGPKSTLVKQQFTDTRNVEKKIYVGGKETKTYAAKVAEVSEGSLNTSVNQFSPSKEIVAAGINPGLVVVADLCENALFGPGVGPAMFAYQRGWANNYPTYPLAAISYMGKILLSACLNTNPLCSKIPRWLSAVYQALLPKTITEGKRRVTYSWSTTAQVATFTLPSLFPNGPSGASTNMNFGCVSTNGEVNNGVFNTGVYPILSNAYDPDDEEKAWASLMQYLQALNPHDPMHEMVGTLDTNAYSNDASAFAISTSNPGGAFAGSGAPGSRKSLEVDIKTPMLSVFTNLVDSVASTNRCPKESVISGGGALELGFLARQLTMSTLRKVRQPKFKYIDFLHTCDKIFRSLTAAIQMRVNDAAARLVTMINPSSALANVKTDMCLNMTIQDAMHIVRNEFMQALDQTQLFCQSLYPDITNPQGFVPFTATIGTAPLTGVESMNLPLLLCEEIKSYVARMVDVPASSSNSKYKHETELVIGVLGQIFGRTLNTNDYRIAVPGLNPDSNPEYVNLFLDYPSSKVKLPSSPAVHKKHNSAQLSDEVAISLIDGSGGSSFYAINSPDYLNPRILEWNLKITQSGAYVQGLTKVGKDGGVVTSLDKTIYISADRDDHKKRKERIRSNIKLQDAMSGYGSDVVVVKTTYRDAPIKTVTELLPYSAPIYVVHASPYEDDLTITNIATLNNEWYNSDDSVTNDGVLYSENTVDTVNSTFNDREAKDNGITQALKEINLKGGGGFFADALGVLGGVVGNIGGTVIDSIV